MIDVILASPLSFKLFALPIPAKRQNHTKTGESCKGEVHFRASGLHFPRIFPRRQIRRRRMPGATSLASLAFSTPECKTLAADARRPAKRGGAFFDRGNRAGAAFCLIYAYDLLECLEPAEWISAFFPAEGKNRIPPSPTEKTAMSQQRFPPGWGRTVPSPLPNPRTFAIVAGPLLRGNPTATWPSLVRPGRQDRGASRRARRLAVVQDGCGPRDGGLPEWRGQGASVKESPSPIRRLNPKARAGRREWSAGAADSRERTDRPATGSQRRCGLQGDRHTARRKSRTRLRR